MADRSSLTLTVTVLDLPEFVALMQEAIAAVPPGAQRLTLLRRLRLILRRARERKAQLRRG